jgi:hypothetical protein
MTDGFEVQVPITIKGGNEGEKVGKQIGEKIAEQIKKVNRAAGITTTRGGTGMDSSSLAGVSKGLKGVVGKLGVIGVAVAAAVGLLAQSSPYLKGILSIFGRAFMMFFRPFGDFLATILRPLAILMMKMAVAFLKWTRPLQGKVREAMNEVPQIGTTGNTLMDIPIEIANWALKLGAALGAIIFEIGKGAFDLGGKIGQWLYDKVINPAGEWLASKIFGMWTWTKNFAGWLWEKITSIWQWVMDFPGWIWGKITSIWNWVKNFPQWIWEKVTGIWSWGYNLGQWLWNRITDALSNIGSWLSGVGTYLWNRITESIKAALSNFAFGWKFWWQKGQVGIPNVPHEGLYYLHKGEEVVPRTKVGQKGGGSVVLNPTYNFNGSINSSIDVDDMVRRSSKMTVQELKQRGVI